MAFIGMAFGMVFIAIFLIIVVMMITFLVTAFILKSVGKRKQRPRLRVVGNVLLVIGIVLAIPVVILFGNIIYNSMYEEITMPDGNSVYVSEKDIDKMTELMIMNDEGVNELAKLLDEEPDLIYYLDVNRKGILEYGLENGKYELVEVAIKHGARFDDPNRYEHMAYEHNSMDFYLSNIIGRELTSEDIEILTLMFNSSVSMDYDNAHQGVYSNLFGKAVWSILYNDEYVTDIEIEFIQIFIDNGFSEDDNLLLYDEMPSNISFSSEYNADVEKDDNYYYLMTMIGME